MRLNISVSLLYLMYRFERYCICISKVRSGRLNLERKPHLEWFEPPPYLLIPYQQVNISIKCLEDTHLVGIYETRTRPWA